MNTVSFPPALGLSILLFLLGLAGLLTRRNLLFVLISLEVMFNAAGLAFIAAGARHGQPDGQVMFLFILAMAASEVAVGLALVVRLGARQRRLDVDLASRLRG